MKKQELIATLKLMGWKSRSSAIWDKGTYNRIYFFSDSIATTVDNVTKYHNHQDYQGAHKRIAKNIKTV